MQVHAINTLQIRFADEPDTRFEDQLRAHAALCGQATGCLGYALTRSPEATTVWLLSGHWANDEALAAHYRDDALQALLRFLVEARASLQFAVLEADGNGT